ncbi:MAG: hypothetical protein ACJZ83_01610 [Pseudohongiellaceae bacterium]
MGGNGWYQSLYAAYTQISYDTNTGATNSLRDVNQLLFTAGLTKIAGQRTHSLNLYHAYEDPKTQLSAAVMVADSRDSRTTCCTD